MTPEFEIDNLRDELEWARGMVESGLLEQSFCDELELQIAELEEMLPKGDDENAVSI